LGGTILTQLDTAAACLACLDSRECWVCLGTGKVEVSPSRWDACSACDGTGVCPKCRVPSQRT
jgi:hypothetical protein